MKTEFWKKQWVKIRMGKSQASAEIVYHKNDMEFEFYWRWSWYFKYLAAKFQVDNPRYFVEFSTGSYDYVPNVTQRAKRLKDRITAKKAKMTKVDKAWNQFRSSYNSLFPLEEHPKYLPTINAINQLKCELQNLEQEYLVLIQSAGKAE